MARLFDDANNEYMANANAVVAGYPLTLACWALRDDQTAWTTRVLLAIANNAVVGGWRYFEIQMYRTDVDAGQTARIQVWDGVGNSVVNSTTTWTVNQWHHICGVMTNATDRAIFLDGGGKATDVNNRTPDSLDVTQIGARNLQGAMSQYMSGRIAEAGIWNVALTDDEVAALAGGVSPTRIRPESLVAYWPLYGVGSPEPDYWGTYNMTLVSGDSGPVQADHAPVQPPFGFDVGWIVAPAAPPITRIPRIPAAYNTLAIY